MTVTTSRSGRTTRRGRPGAGRLALVAVLAPLLVWLIADPLGGVDLRVRQGSGWITVGPVAIVVVALLVSAAALGLAAFFSRRGRGTHVPFLVVTGTLFLVSLLGPLGAATLSAGVVLAAMHVAVAGTLIPGCARRITPCAAGSGEDG